MGYVDKGEYMDKNNKLVFKAIADVRGELAMARKYGTAREQLDIFKRLTALYASINIKAELEEETTKEIEVKISKAS